MASDHTRRKYYVPTGMEAWFTPPPGAHCPPKHKMAILTWLALYPITTLLLLAIGSAVDGLPLPARTLIVTAVMVPLMTYAVMPVVTRLFARWLYSQPSEASGWVERPTTRGAVRERT